MLPGAQCTLSLVSGALSAESKGLPIAVSFGNMLRKCNVLFMVSDLFHSVYLDVRNYKNKQLKKKSNLCSTKNVLYSDFLNIIWRWGQHKKNKMNAVPNCTSTNALSSFQGIDWPFYRSPAMKQTCYIAGSTMKDDPPATLFPTLLNTERNSRTVNDCTKGSAHKCWCSIDPRLPVEPCVPQTRSHS